MRGPGLKPSTRGPHLQSEVLALPRTAIKLLFCVLCLSWLPMANAGNEPPAFDLSGPRVEIKVARAGKTLRISEVPNLAVGDRLWVHPDLPPGQSVHYLLVVAFLRG